MGYVAPLGNAVHFVGTAQGYAPPPGDAVDFDGSVIAQGAAQVPFSAAAVALHGVGSSGGGALWITGEAVALAHPHSLGRYRSLFSGEGVGFVVPTASSAAWLVLEGLGATTTPIRGVGSGALNLFGAGYAAATAFCTGSAPVKFSGTGLATFSKVVIASGVGAVKPSATGVATSHPRGGGAAKLAMSGYVLANVGRSGQGAGALRILGNGRSACGRTALGIGGVPLSGRGLLYRGVSASGGAGLNLRANGWGVYTRATTGTGVGAFHITGLGCASHYPSERTAAAPVDTLYVRSTPNEFVVLL